MEYYVGYPSSRGNSREKSILSWDITGCINHKYPCLFSSRD